MSNPSIPRRAGKCLLCGGFLCGNLTEVYENFTKLRFLTLHFFSILGNVNEVKKKESSEKGHKKGDYIMRNYLVRRNNENNNLDFFDDAFNSFFKPMFYEEKFNTMKTDIKETENGYVMDVEIPGFDKKDVNVSLKDGYLTITAEKT